MAWRSEDAKLTHSLNADNNDDSISETAKAILEEIEGPLFVSDETIESFISSIKSSIETAPFSSNKEKSTFTFIDLFAGIGGFRIALQNLGGSCVYSSEWDTESQKTYLYNFGKYPFGYILQIHR